MVQTLGVLLEGSVRGVLVNVGPAEAVASVGRVAEVIDLVAGGPEGLNDIGVVLVPPTGGNVYLGYIERCC